MPRGGRRPGAGRKKKLDFMPPLPRQIWPLRELLARLPDGQHHRERRMVLALSACGLDEVLIAQILGISAEAIKQWFSEELELGRMNLRWNVNLELDNAAAGNGRRPSVAAMIHILNRLDREDAQARASSASTARNAR